MWYPINSSLSLLLKMMFIITFTFWHHSLRKVFHLFDHMLYKNNHNTIYLQYNNNNEVIFWSFVLCKLARFKNQIREEILACAWPEKWTSTLPATTYTDFPPRDNNCIITLSALVLSLSSFPSWCIKECFVLWMYLLFISAFHTLIR